MDLNTNQKTLAGSINEQLYQHKAKAAHAKAVAAAATKVEQQFAQ